MLLFQQTTKRLKKSRQLKRCFDKFKNVWEELLRSKQKEMSFTRVNPLFSIAPVFTKFSARNYALTSTTFVGRFGNWCCNSSFFRKEHILLARPKNSKQRLKILGFFKQTVFFRVNVIHDHDQQLFSRYRP